jgi:hypothetical protein
MLNLFQHLYQIPKQVRNDEKNEKTNLNIIMRA